ncbi:MAG: isoprenylcysteine carboxyl methyltransferase family protein [Micrococcales bacterium]|nr:isoprenylcysteine carboxyl methyltransferase family protein [Micrococcales bacterium]
MSGSQGAYVGLVLLVGVARLVELRVASRNLARGRARGGVEHGAGHYPVMVVLHAALLVGCIAEVTLADRPFLPWLGWPMLGLLVAAHVLRWWCVRSLGPAWTTRVLVVPGAPLVTSGPYRLLRHPNYVAVAAEGVALPLVHTAWLTALVFTVVNAVLLLGVRIPVEERALRSVSAGRSHP